MKILRNPEAIKQSYPAPVLAIGVFDGLHIGHQRLIRRVKTIARKINGTTMVMTFFPHPVQVLRPDSHLPLIVSLPHRLRLIEELGIDVCIVIRFTHRFSLLTPEQFIRRFLVEKLAVREVMVGDDFRFGQNRSGTLDYFQRAGTEYGFHVHSLKTVKGDTRKISSSTIRELIAAGDLRGAAALLGRPVSLLGRVVRGDGRGRTLGYPTANLNPAFTVTPPRGVYVVRIGIAGKKYDGIANVGFRPSFKESDRQTIEVHIFDFEGNLYQREIIVEFLEKIRDERRFGAKEDLIRQLQKDERKAKELLRLG